MKVMIISDIHGSAKYLKKVLDIYHEEKCEKLLILGDILYHGPRNDLPELYNPKECIKLLNPMKDEILTVKGNCDAEVDEMVLDFPIPVFRRFSLCGFDLYLTHGHHVNPEHPIDLPKGTVVLFGHSHVHEITDVNGVIFINPGSISIPKGDKINSFGIMEDNSIKIMDLEKNILMEYSK